MVIHDVPEQPIDLRRFFEAQSKYAQQVLDELSRGKKESHWMYFTFPQMRGLGLSKYSVYFAIQSIEHAREFMAHRGLANRLRYHTKMVLAHKDKSIEDIFSLPDNLKFHSSMTLFALASERDVLFQQALDTFFKGKKDPLTLQILSDQMNAEKK